MARKKKVQEEVEVPVVEVTEEVQEEVEVPVVEVTEEEVTNNFDNIAITDYAMVSNDLARKILEKKGKKVLFEEPEDVQSSFHMKPLKK